MNQRSRNLAEEAVAKTMSDEERARMEAIIEAAPVVTPVTGSGS
jgi:hypothetical protein